MKKNNVILDCDTGEDDALAILLAVANKLPLTHIVTSYGNTSLANATRNTSRILSLANERTVSVIPGSKAPLGKHPIEKDVSAGDFVGKNGICNVKLPRSKYNNILKTGENDFVDTLTEILTFHAPVDYIVTGPCTNLAKVLLALGGSAKKYIRSVYIMGGALYASGNSGPIDRSTHGQFAEFNFYCDAKAVQIVLQSRLPIYLVTWDVTRNVTISYEELSHVESKTSVGSFVLDLMKSFFTYYGLGHDRNFEFNDPLTILAAMGIGTYRKEKISIVTKGVAYGKIVPDEKGYMVNYFTPIQDTNSLVMQMLEKMGVEFT